jgi:prepilin-type N-terminal cleavage/methylation domain-containing protein
MTKNANKNAFTMLELIFVIVIMGILSKFGVELIKQTYDSYTQTLVINKLESESEVAVLQIANRLRYRIKDSVEYNATSLRWVGIDNEGWELPSGTAGAWSGIIDLDASTKTNLVSPGTTGTQGNYAIIFLGANVDMNNSNNNYIPVTLNTGSLSPVTAFNTGDDIYEFYQLTKNAFQIDIKGTSLYLTKMDYNQSSSNYPNPPLLVDHVSGFTYQKYGDIIKIELCLNPCGFFNTQSGCNDIMGTGVKPICKQKIIF